MEQESYEESIVREFLAAHFTPSISTVVDEPELDTIREIIDYVSTRFAQMKYILGLAIDFTLLAQKLSAVDSKLITSNPDLTESELFERYQLVEAVGARQSNTLTLTYGDTREGIRRLEEEVANFFHQIHRSGYPSAYVYNTGQWHKYKDLLLLCFSLSEPARFELVKQLIAFGQARIAKNSYFIRESRKVRLFEEIVNDYPRGAIHGENGGLIFQAIAYGLYAADRPHLALVTDKVRSGSTRQRRFGDIDAYYGLDLEEAIEVKDFVIDARNFEPQLGQFSRQCSGLGLRGTAFIKDADDDGQEQLIAAGIRPVTQVMLLEQVSSWDWQKQDSAVQALLHFIAHIEQNAAAVNRLLAFIKTLDSEHDSLAYLTGIEEGG